MCTNYFILNYRTFINSLIFKKLTVAYKFLFCFYSSFKLRIVTYIAVELYMI